MGRCRFSFLNVGGSAGTEQPYLLLIDWGARSARGMHTSQSPESLDSVTAVAQVSHRELKKLMAAHVRFGNRNFRSVATAQG